MKRAFTSPLYLICPSIPSLCVDISSYEDIETLEDAWRVFGDSKDNAQDRSRLTAMEVEGLFVEKEIQFSTKISDYMVKSQGTKLIAVHKNDESRRFSFSYHIYGLSTKESCGIICLSHKTASRVLNTVLYIVLRHRLLYDIFDPLSSNTYVLGVELTHSKTKFFTNSEENWLEKVSRKLFLHLYITKEAEFVVDSDDAFSPQVFTIPAFILNSNNMDSVKRHIGELRRDALKTGQKLKLIDEYTNVQEFVDDLCSEDVIWKKRVHYFPIDSSLEEATLEHYENVADKIVVSLEWQDYFSELNSKLQEFKTLHVLLPRSYGKTQLAFNLSRHYKVIYVSCKNMFKSSATFIEMFKKAIEVDKGKENVLLSELKSSFNLYGPGPAFPAVLRLTTNNGLIHAFNSNVVALFAKIMENTDSQIATLSEWIQYDLQTSALQLNSAFTIYDFREKYGSVLKDYVFYIDDYGWQDSFMSTKEWLQELEVYRFIKYLGITLGFHVVTSGSSLIDADNNILTEDDLRSDADFKLKWSSMLLRPFPFSIKYLENSWEEERLQSTLAQDIAGDPASIQALALFLIEHLSSQSYEYLLLIYNALLKAMEKLEEAKKLGNRIHYEKFSEILFQEAYVSVVQKLEYESPLPIKEILSLDEKIELKSGNSAITLWNNVVKCRCEGSDETCNTRFIDIYVQYDEAKLYKGTSLEGCRNNPCHQMVESDIWKNDFFVALSHVVAILKFGRNVIGASKKNCLFVTILSLLFIIH